MNDEPALTQICRLLGLARGSLTAEEARSLPPASLDRLAAGLAAEAADSDDVLDRASALDYLQDRLTTLGPCLPPGASDLIADRFEAIISAWARP